eukprot:5123455-Amphidinium_carterae.1
MSVSKRKALVDQVDACPVGKDLEPAEEFVRELLALAVSLSEGKPLEERCSTTPTCAHLDRSWKGRNNRNVKGTHKSCSCNLHHVRLLTKWSKVFYRSIHANSVNFEDDVAKQLWREMNRTAQPPALTSRLICMQTSALV